MSDTKMKLSLAFLFVVAIAASTVLSSCTAPRTGVSPARGSTESSEPAARPRSIQPARSGCSKRCKKGKPCGCSCIAISKTCHK